MNRATKNIVSIMGLQLGIAGMDHGFFEALQGSTPTNGLIIQAIGPANRMWIHGTEEAFSIVPNFLITGLLAMMVSILIMVWSVRYVHTKKGPLVLFLLFLGLFLVGGGIGQVVFFSIACGVATQINHPLTWWRNLLPENLRLGLAKVWPFSLGVGSLMFLLALEIAIFGIVPGVSDPDQKLYICWSFLGICLVFFLITIVSGFAHDSEIKIGAKII